MSVQQNKLCSAILEQHFGENVRIVGDSLFSAVQSRTLQSIIKSTGLKRIEVIRALAILIKFRLAYFKPVESPNVIEYFLDRERILLILRYPRYVFLIQSKFKQAAASLIEEVLRCGCDSASAIIARCFDVKEKNSIVVHRDTFFELIQSHYLIRAPYVNRKNEDDVPIFVDETHILFVLPEVDLQEIIQIKNNEKITTKDNDIKWLANLVRFHQDFQDSIIISAVERKIDQHAAECFTFILELMYARTDAWKGVSNPIPFVDMRQAIEKKSNNIEMIKYLDQYISICCDDQLKFLDKYGDMGGGQYVVLIKNIIEQLTWCCIENVIMEKFGSKAARIFRVVRVKKYIEQEDIQKEAMIPSKEAKLYTYKLLEEHFLQIKTIRKAGGGGTGMAKSFYLFYVNQGQIVSMLLETCYKALFNSMTRSNYNNSENRRLIEKSQRIEGIVEAMKERGESEEYINDILETLAPPEREILKKVKIRIKNLYSAEIGLDETIFLLKLFERYKITDGQL